MKVLNKKTILILISLFGTVTMAEKPINKQINIYNLQQLNQALPNTPLSSNPRKNFKPETSNERPSIKKNSFDAVPSSFGKVSSSARKGGVSGGGGTGIHCSSSIPKKFMMLDTYEGILKGYTYNKMSGLSMNEIIANVLQKFSRYPLHEKVLRNLIERVKNKILVLPAETELKIQNDVEIGPNNKIGNVSIPEECRPYMFGYYEALNVLFVSDRIDKEADELEKAAFILHEAVYLGIRELRPSYQIQLFRSSGSSEVDENTRAILKSQEARKIVAILLADQTTENDFDLQGLRFLPTEDGPIHYIRGDEIRLKVKREIIFETKEDNLPSDLCRTIYQEFYGKNPTMDDYKYNGNCEQIGKSKVISYQTYVVSREENSPVFASGYHINSIRITNPIFPSRKINVRGIFSISVQDSEVPLSIYNFNSATVSSQNPSGRIEFESEGSVIVLLRGMEIMNFYFGSK